MKKIILGGISAVIFSCAIGVASAYNYSASAKKSITTTVCACPDCSCQDCSCTDCSTGNCDADCCNGNSGCSGECCEK